MTANTLRAAGVVLLGISCSPDKHAVLVTTGSGTGSLSSATASIATATSTLLTTAAPSTSAPVEGWLPSEVSSEPFVVDPRFPECIHPGVTQDCAGGWCKVPAGCYLFGTSEDFPAHAAVSEEQGPVTLTYDMEVMQHELTWTDYDRITGWPRKIYTGECSDDQCPANMSWWEAMLLANLLSEQHNPPLAKCYDLGDTCHQTPGDRMWCPNYKLHRPGHECLGYRMPNQFEWQYFARGGTGTDFYTGNMQNPATLKCVVDPALQKIAWYCGNSPTFAAHPVGQLLPNRWGLYDLFGNVIESLQTLRFAAPGVAVTDPVEPNADGQLKTDAAGGNAVSFPSIMYAAGHFASDFSGLRLVRTLGPGVPPTLKR